ncbi:MAG: hypothetical protein MRY72_11405 [Aquisalinus sp.]|nr:hypothetical protein [Aquisalinus sp.]
MSYDMLVSSVVRASQRGNVHGYLYALNTETKDKKIVLQYDDSSIDFAGRGAERGLRGICEWDGKYIAASNNKLFIFNQDFEVEKQFEHPYFAHIHEICIQGDSLYVTSTGFDLIMALEMPSFTFRKGWYFIKENDEMVMKIADSDAVELEAKDQFHINNVYVSADNKVYFGGVGLEHLYCIDTDDTLSSSGKLRRGTHNLQPFGDGIIANSTQENCVRFWNHDGSPKKVVRLPNLSIESDKDTDEKVARANFNRGLAITPDQQYIYVGSSPSSVFKVQVETGEIVDKYELSDDMRNSVHGILLLA